MYNSKQQRVGTVTIEEREQQAVHKKRRAWPIHILRFLPLWLALGVAVVIRIWLAIHTNGQIDGDEAVVAIQAQHILHGEFPVYFYGQVYMGSLEAYLIALIFTIAGSSVWAARAEPILLSLLLVWLTWALAAALARQARLSSNAALVFQSIAAFFAALPPLYDTVVELRVLGGYIETFILMLLLLLSGLRLTQRWSAGASRKELAWRWAGIGFVSGLGLWVDPLIILVIVVVALWITGYIVHELIKNYQQLPADVRYESPTAVLHPLKKVCPAVIALPSALLGCAPALYWGAMNHWQNVTYIFSLNSTSSLSYSARVLYPTRLALIKGMAGLYMNCIAPRVIGGAVPFENSIRSSDVYMAALALSIVSIIAILAMVTTSLLANHPLLASIRDLVGLPLLFAATSVVFFCTSTAAAVGLGCDRDLAGRYAVPLVLALPFFFAATITFVSISLNRLTQHLARQSFRKQNGQAAPTSDVPGRKRGLILAAQGILALVVLFSAFAEVITYQRSDPGLTFQSPYCTIAPANNDPIITYLEREHIHYGWAANWIGFPIIFKTKGSIILADPTHTLNRFPQDVVVVQHADRPSIFLLVQHGNAHPLLLQMLDTEHVTYRVAFFPSERGMDVMIVTPLNRTVSPDTFISMFHCAI